MPNYIRVKQINPNELSGFFVDSISSESGLLLDLAEQAALNALSSGTVLLTGNQTISGNKTFLNNLNVSGDLTVAGTLRYNEIIDTTVTGNISGYTGVFTQVFANNLVYNTGNQTISGLKTFAQTGSFNTLQITNKKLSSYNYSTSNFIFGDNYVNLINSSTNITGTLPSEITSGINYYIKNLNTGILLITGSGQRTIDGFSTVNLYKNESLQLVGVNNVGYTGWVTISADNGVS